MYETLPESVQKWSRQEARLTEQQMQELRADKASGMTMGELEVKYGLKKSLLYYYINRHKYLVGGGKYYKYHEKKKEEPTSKQFKVKVSGVNCIVNLPQTMGVEVEITNEALIFNII